MTLCLVSINAVLNLPTTTVNGIFSVPTSIANSVTSVAQAAGSTVSSITFSATSISSSGFMIVAAVVFNHNVKEIVEPTPVTLYY